VANVNGTSRSTPLVLAIVPLPSFNVPRQIPVAVRSMAMATSLDDSPPRLRCRSKPLLRSVQLQQLRVNRFLVERQDRHGIGAHVLALREMLDQPIRIGYEAAGLDLDGRKRRGFAEPL